MANSVTIENNFTGGLKTEFTGLNFPEHSCTDVDNCYFDIVGDVTRRAGINYEQNYQMNNVIGHSGVTGVNTYKWRNVSSDGTLQILVVQADAALYFFRMDNATTASPISTKYLGTVDLTGQLVAGSSANIALTDCEFTDGNGYLFVFHPDVNPLYITYVSGTFTLNPISVKIRDFAGLYDSYGVNTRPTLQTIEHRYNLQNQGWTTNTVWGGVAPPTSGGNTLGVRTFFGFPAGLPVTIGDSVSIYNNFANSIPYRAVGFYQMSGLVTNYVGTNITINVLYSNVPNEIYSTGVSWYIYQNNTGLIDTWNANVGNYPSNSDVWWNFKNASGIFSPGTTYSNNTTNAGLAPRGHYIYDAFNINRQSLVQLAVTNQTTLKRPSTGVWFQERIWYTGVNDAYTADSNNRYSWAEKIYFSQTIETPDQFGSCYQVNDPTAENLFDLLPTDGGIITIQGSGNIIKLFPIQNGLLVFATNGVWFITGSKGIGFSANDYTITKISSVRSISPYSFVDVLGMPMFWNEEGIYQVEPTQQGSGLQVNPITVGSILSFYNNIPFSSKKYVRGIYNPIEYVVQWVYKSTDGVSSTYHQFDKILNYNTYNKAFYPYTIGGFVYGVNYATMAPQNPTVNKYLVISGSNITFAEEYDESYLDFGSTDYESYFVTGYNIKGQGLMKFSPTYVYVFSRMNGDDSTYDIQAVWDYAANGNSSKFSTKQRTNIPLGNSVMEYRRHRLRGRGLALQIKVSSASGQPFDIMGWTMLNNVNSGV